MPRVIEVIVAKDGGITIQTKGYSGSSCLEASRPFEHALGITTEERRTGEFFENAQTEERVQQSE
jgi:hypothetical protein